jgi:hypothetical protein
MKKLKALLSVLMMFVFFVSNSKAQNTFTHRKLEFRGKVFTDFEGIKADQPNGLIQTNLYFSYVRRYDSVKYSKIVPLRNIVLADFTFSKIEQNNRELPVRYLNQDSIYGYLNQLDLYQYANIKVTTKLNLITLELFENKDESFRAYFDIIGTFYRTALHDSLKISDSKNVISIASGINLRMKYYADPKSKLSAELSYTYFKPSLFTGSYREIAGPQYLDHKGQITQDMVNEKKSGINIIDLIIGHDGNNSTQFLRVSISGNYFFKQANTAPNIFYQIQMGLDYKLDNIFSSKDKKDKTTQQNQSQ